MVQSTKRDFTHQDIISLPFNPAPVNKLHIDLNSCFASVEQQANPLLRGRPIAVAAYVSDWGCILAPSREAKVFGVKTGMRVKDARPLCPDLLVMPADPNKYRVIHLRLKKLLSRYSDRVVPKSIDEFVLDFSHQQLATGVGPGKVLAIGREIKQRILTEIGDFLTVSVGIGPNQWLAKTGAGLHKPDGLDQIDQTNFLEVYKGLELRDLCGIAWANERRLNKVGILTVLDFYQAPVWKLKAAFESVNGYYWYARLRGFEIDEVEFGRKSYGNSFALPPDRSSFEQVVPVIQKLVEKMGARVRAGGYRAGGVHLALGFRDGRYWARGHKLARNIFDSRDIFQQIYRLLQECPQLGAVRNVAVSCFDLRDEQQLQLELFKDVDRLQKTVAAVDSINQRWGQFVVSPATMMAAADLVHDRIAFGNVKELSEMGNRIKVI